MDGNNSEEIECGKLQYQFRFGLSNDILHHQANFPADVYEGKTDDVFIPYQIQFETRILSGM